MSNTTPDPEIRFGMIQKQLDQVHLELRGIGRPLLSDDPLWSPTWQLAHEARVELARLKDRQRLLDQAAADSMARHLADAARCPAAQRP